MKAIGITIIPSALLCAGCAIYSGVDTSLPSAELSFSKSYTDVRFARSAMQVYAFGDEPQCENIRPVAIFTWVTGDRKTTRFEAGKRIAAVTYTHYIESGPGPLLGDVEVTLSDCKSTASFVPEAGHAYALSQHADINRCQLEIIDLTTGAPPPSLEPISAACAIKATAYTGVD